MNSIYFLTFLFLFSFINSALDPTTCSSANYHLIDTGNRHYKSDISFDWTSEDEYELNVPFTELKSKDEIIPFLVKATVVKYGLSNIIVPNDANHLTNTFQGYKYVNVIPDERYSIHKNVLRANIKSTDIKANENNVGEVYKYYFGWVECRATGYSYEISNIMVSVNNGKFYQISKYLLFVIVGLLL